MLESLLHLFLGWKQKPSTLCVCDNSILSLVSFFFKSVFLFAVKGSVDDIKKFILNLC